MSLEQAIAANTAAINELIATLRGGLAAQAEQKAPAKREPAQVKPEKTPAPAATPTNGTAQPAPAPAAEPGIAELRAQCSQLVLKSVNAKGKEATLALLQAVHPDARNVTTVPDEKIPALKAALTGALA